MVAGGTPSDVCSGADVCSGVDACSGINVFSGVDPLPYAAQCFISIGGLL